MAGYIGNKAVNLSTSGADISGTANLDTVDIDGAVDFASTTAHAGNASFADNAKAIFGAGSDLQIYHDGSNSYIDETGTGTLRIRGYNQVRITDTSDNIAAIFKGDAETTLYHNNASKLATSSTGVDITGTLTSDGLTVDSVDINGATVAWQNGGTNQTYFTTTGSSEQALILRLDNQNLSSAGYFEVQDGSAGRKLLTVDDGGDLSLYEDTGTTAKFFWDASAESLGIGTSSPSALLDVQRTTIGTIANFRGSDAARDFTIASSTTTSLGDTYTLGATSSTGEITFATATAERMRIDSSGNLLVGKSSQTGTGVGIELEADGTFYVGKTGDVATFNRTTSVDGTLIDFQKQGTTVGSISVTGSSTAYNTSSDYRLKTDAQPMTGASARVQALNPVNFKWIADGTRVDGFLAHEAQAVVPEAVTGTKDAMMDEEYQVSAATGDIYTAGSEAGFNEVSAAIEASPAYYDVDGNIIKAEVIAKAAVHEAYDAVNEVIHSTNVEQPETLADGQQWRETTAAVMGTRSVPDMQGIDQSKLVPLLVASLQEALARITALENT